MNQDPCIVTSFGHHPNPVRAILSKFTDEKTKSWEYVSSSVKWVNDRTRLHRLLICYRIAWNSQDLSRCKAPGIQGSPVKPIFAFSRVEFRFGFFFFFPRLLKRRRGGCVVGRRGRRREEAAAPHSSARPAQATVALCRHRAEERGECMFSCLKAGQEACRPIEGARQRAE